MWWSHIEQALCGFLLTYIQSDLLVWAAGGLKVLKVHVCVQHKQKHTVCSEKSNQMQNYVSVQKA